MKITGADLSLRRTGVAHIWPDRRMAVTARIEPHARLGTSHERLQFVLVELGSHLRGADLVLLEAPAYSKNNTGTSQINGLWWLVAHGLWKRGTPYAVATAPQVKIFATGKGSHIDKDDVLAAMIKRYPDVDIAGNDGADALALAGIGAHYLGCPLRPVPQTHSRVVEAINWPQAAIELKENLGASQEAI